MSLVAWIVRQDPSHPARAVLETAQAAGVLSGMSGPVAVSAPDPVLWLAAWSAGKIVRWQASGLGGWCDLRGVPCETTIPAAAAPALIWAQGGIERVYSHGAVYEAVRETAKLRAHGRGLLGPAGFVQGASSWFHGLTFGGGGFWWPDPEGLGWVTNGARRVRCLPELLGAFMDTDEDDGATTRIEAGSRLKSRRLYDGVWTGDEVMPAHFLYGWLALRYSISEVS